MGGGGFSLLREPWMKVSGRFMEPERGGKEDYKEPNSTGYSVSRETVFSRFPPLFPLSRSQGRYLKRISIHDLKYRDLGIKVPG